VSEAPRMPALSAQDLAEVARRLAVRGLSAQDLAASLPGTSREWQRAQQHTLLTAIRQRVEQRLARQHSPRLSLAGHLCEQCLDAPATLLQPAPWGGEMGVCAACAGTVGAS
jgi:hypothetical protein